MDTLGARYLAARLRAGVRVGTTIVLDGDDPTSDLVAGDRGVVSAITTQDVIVDWDRGFQLGIDPLRVAYHAVEAA